MYYLSYCFQSRVGSCNIGKNNICGHANCAETLSKSKAESRDIRKNNMCGHANCVETQRLNQLT